MMFDESAGHHLINTRCRGDHT